MFAMHYPREILSRGRVCLALSLLSCFLIGGLSAQDAPVPEEDIREAKPLVEIPQVEPMPIAFWAGVGGGLVLAAAAYALWKMRSRKKELRKSPPEIALATLAALEREHEDLAAEAFANRAAQIVRQYLADRFSLAATRRSTEEFFRDLTEMVDGPLASESDALRGFLKSCDLAKFAGVSLDAPQRELLLDSARGLIAATRTNPQAGKS
jgi:hypothetical protein